MLTLSFDYFTQMAIAPNSMLIKNSPIASGRQDGGSGEYATTAQLTCKHACTASVSTHAQNQSSKITLLSTLQGNKRLRFIMHLHTAAHGQRNCCHRKLDCFMLQSTHSQAPQAKLMSANAFVVCASPLSA
jgi:hypothetical protein